MFNNWGGSSTNIHKISCTVTSPTNEHTTITILYSTDGSIAATLTIIPSDGLVPESIGFVQACAMLDAEPTGDVMITLHTTDIGSAQGKLFICNHSIL